MKMERCETCSNYKEQADREGKEWEHTTGWCTLPNINSKHRKVHYDNWCDMYNENAEYIASYEVPNPIHTDEAKTSPDVEPTDEQSYEFWKLTIKEQIADIRKKLDALEALAETPIGDLE